VDRFARIAKRVAKTVQSDVWSPEELAQFQTVVADSQKAYLKKVNETFVAAKDDFAKWKEAAELLAGEDVSKITTWMETLTDLERVWNELFGSVLSTKGSD
jgi:hypothetical protein